VTFDTPHEAVPGGAPLERVRVVLCHTSHPGNIGGCARAMKTMGLRSLVLVDPKHFPHDDAQAMASRATDILQGARVCTDLDAALSDTVYAAACTARSRDLSHEALTPREAAARMLEAARQGPVALVMGPEKYGLTGQEVNRCSVITTIPANPEYSSLNLAAAVQLYCYELRLAASGIERLPQRAAEPATHEELERFMAHLEQAVLDLGFLDPHAPKRLMQRLRRLFTRARLEREEVNILRGILAFAQAAVRRAGTS
jgi:tRNA/rRNA methyltransferase